MADSTQFHTYTEIVNQSPAWQAVLDESARQDSAIHALWQQANPQQVLFTGCGSTFYLARTAAALFQQSTGIPSQAHPASDLAFFPEITLSPKLRKVMVAISRSGETTETLRAIDSFRAHGGGPVLAITCYDDMPLAQMADFSIVAREAKEISLAQTRSFASMLVAATALALSIGSKPGDRLARLPELGSNLIQQYGGLARTLGEDPTLQRFFFLGSGLYYGLACEGMLKMKEMSLSYSEAFHFFEFRHGPMSMVDPQSLVLGLLSEQAFDREVAVLQQMRAMGARILAFSPCALPTDAADYVVPLPADVRDCERSPLYLPIMQLLAYHRAVGKGLNPDLPTNLTMVVKLDS